MSYEETLYSDIPPTKLRNIDEKFRRAHHYKFWGVIADLFFYNMIQNRFYSLRIKNKENYNKRDDRFANIIYAPHSNWWDGIVGYNVSNRIFKTKLIMMIEELNRFPLLAKVGAFPVNKKSAQSAMKALKYASDELANDPVKSLWLFPQGIIRPPHYRPIIFQSGITYIAQSCIKKSGGINLIPVCVNYFFLREDKPEVVVDVQDPMTITDFSVVKDRKLFTDNLAKDFQCKMEAQYQDITAGKLDGYEYLFRQKLPWYKKIEKRLKRIDIKN